MGHFQAISCTYWNSTRIFRHTWRRWPSFETWTLRASTSSRKGRFPCDCTRVPCSGSHTYRNPKWSSRWCPRSRCLRCAGLAWISQLFWSLRRYLPDRHSRMEGRRVRHSRCCFCWGNQGWWPRGTGRWFRRPICNASECRTSLSESWQSYPSFFTFPRRRRLLRRGARWGRVTWLVQERAHGRCGTCQTLRLRTRELVALDHYHRSCSQMISLTEPKFASWL